MNTYAMRLKYPELDPLIKKLTPEPSLFDTKGNRDRNYDEKIRPTLSKRQTLVLEAVKTLGNCTMHTAALFLGVELYTISGRFGELVNLGKIKVVGRKDKKSVYSITEG